jgi:hypothetical protein
VIVGPHQSILELAADRAIVVDVLVRDITSDNFVVCRWSLVEPDYILEMEKSDMFSHDGNTRYSDLLREYDSLVSQYPAKVRTLEQIEDLLFGRSSTPVENDGLDDAERS